MAAMAAMEALATTAAIAVVSAARPLVDSLRASGAAAMEAAEARAGREVDMAASAGRAAALAETASRAAVVAAAAAEEVRVLLVASAERVAAEVCAGHSQARRRGTTPGTSERAARSAQPYQAIGPPQPTGRGSPAIGGTATADHGCHRRSVRRPCIAAGRLPVREAAAARAGRAAGVAAMASSRRTRAGRRNRHARTPLPR